MITAIEIKSALCRLLKKKFDYPVYGMEVLEGFQRPSFFVDVRQTESRDENVSYTKKSFYIAITYFQKHRNEKDIFDKVNQIESMLRPNSEENPKGMMRLLVAGRHLSITDFETNYIGENRDILQVDFETEFYEKREHRDNLPFMEEIHIAQELKDRR